MYSVHNVQSRGGKDTVQSIGGGFNVLMMRRLRHERDQNDAGQNNVEVSSRRDMTNCSDRCRVLLILTYNRNDK